VTISTSALMGTSRDDYSEAYRFLRANDNQGLAEMVSQGRLCFIDAGTEGILLEGGLFTMRVRITSGPCSGRAGYITSEFVKKKAG
jgi:hypothetical protein